MQVAGAFQASHAAITFEDARERANSLVDNGSLAQLIDQHHANN